MQTEQDLEDAKKAIERDKQLEAEKPVIARATDRYWEWRERNGGAVIVGLVIFVIVSTVGIVVKACNMQ